LSVAEPTTQPIAPGEGHSPPHVAAADSAGAPGAPGEIVSRRTADSATYDLGDGRYELVQAARPMHYQDEPDAWQRIDPAFIPGEGGRVTAHSPLRPSVAARSSIARLSRADARIGGEPTALYAGGANGQAIMPATPRADVPATLSSDRRAVNYPLAW